jgi:PAS domain S-box-containing protein
MKQKIYIAILAAALILAVIGLYTLDYKGSAKRNIGSKTIRVAGDINYPPYEFMDENGVYKGYNVDIMNSIAIELGINIEFVPMTWGESIEALKEGKVDAIQGITKTELRNRQLYFSEPIARNLQMIFVRKDTTYISSIEDLENHSVVIQAGDINEEVVKVLSGVNVVFKPNQEEALKALIEGEVEAFIGNRLVGLYISQRDKLTEKIKIVGQPVSSAEYCSAVLNGNKEVLDILNEGISRIKKNGTYDKINKKWFGESFYDQRKIVRDTLYLIMIFVAIMSSIFLFILLINKKLKKMVETRTKELTKVNTQLIESEENYRRLFEISPDAVFIHDMDEIIFVNTAALDLVGAKSLKELKGKSIVDFLVSDNVDDYEHLVENFNEEEKTITLHAKKVQRLNNTSVDVEIRITPFVNNGKTVMLSIIRDLTDKILLNEAIEYDKLKTEFFANMSHEFRTPLNVILSTIQLIEMRMKNGEIGQETNLARYVNTMKQNAFRLVRLVNNLIDLTRIEANFYKLKLENYNIISLVEDITFSVREYIENKGINLVFDTDVEEKIAACDPDKIERIMLNLLSNAVKFTPAGGTIEVNIMDIGKSIIISVKDSGIGIPEDKIGMVFERFHQVDKSLTRNHEGSGIGLSLVKSLVEMHKGSISLKSQLGVGSEFIIEMPVSEQSETGNNVVQIAQELSVERINIEFSDIYS